MTVLLDLLFSVGWRGAVGAAVGGALAAAAAFPGGRWVERQVCAERVVRQLAQRDLQRMELDNARIDAALDARRRADRNDFGADDGGLPDDGFRRD